MDNFINKYSDLMKKWDNTIKFNMANLCFMSDYKKCFTWVKFYSEFFMDWIPDHLLFRAYYELW